MARYDLDCVESAIKSQPTCVVTSTLRSTCWYCIGDPTETEMTVGKGAN